MKIFSCTYETLHEAAQILNNCILIQFKKENQKIIHYLLLALYIRMLYLAEDQLLVWKWLSNSCRDVLSINRESAVTVWLCAFFVGVVGYVCAFQAYFHFP